MSITSYFFKQLGENEDGTINRGQWDEAKRRTKATYATSQCLDVLLQFIADFETTHKTFYRSDLREFALESNIEDFIASEENTVFVSTIHKAKGREFDNVHLLLGDIKNIDNDMLRTIYVGITRSKHNLFIYHDISCLSIQPSIALSLSMRDVWLDYFRDRKEQVLCLRSGDKLSYRNGYLVSQKGEYIANLSAAMKDKLKEFAEKGYAVTDAEVSYILAWRPREDPQEVAVCLANLILEKSQQ